MTAPTNVAIACQGGGSHTAFTAGALGTLLPALADDDGRRLVGLSGTSGGALAATAGWYGHVAADADAGEALTGLWDELAADGPMDRWLNEWVVGTVEADNAGFPVARLSPAQNPLDDHGRDRIEDAVAAHVDFDAVADLAGDGAPRLVVGAVNVTAGTFETFVDGDVDARAILASAAVPRLFDSVEIDGDEYWDGLFSQNPPVYDLVERPVDRRPEELWVLQVNPQRRDGAPATLDAIADRRNELAGNLSLNQELHHVETINDLLAKGYLPEDRFVHTEIRRLQLDRELSHASKLDRDPAFVEELFAHGEERAAAFLEDLG